MHTSIFILQTSLSRVPNTYISKNSIPFLILKSASCSPSSLYFWLLNWLTQNFQSSRPPHDRFPLYSPPRSPSRTLRPYRFSLFGGPLVLVCPGGGVRLKFSLLNRRIADRACVTKRGTSNERRNWIEKHIECLGVASLIQLFAQPTQFISS